METIVVKTVEGPNDNGWFQVELADGRTPATKEKPLAELAFKHRDKEIQGEIGEKVNGKFTNLFLNKLEVGDGPVAPVTSNGLPLAPATEIPLPSKRNETQEQIAAQWAFGRAVETFVANGGKLNDIEANPDIVNAATWLLAESKKLAATQ